MKTIVIANQKGGSGKSTITVHLAAAAEQAGDGPIVISDTDPQGTAADWFNQRKRPGSTRHAIPPSPSPICGPGSRPSSEAGAAYLFIDTAPSIGAVNADLFALADLSLSRSTRRRRIFARWSKACRWSANPASHSSSS